MKHWVILLLTLLVSLPMLADTIAFQGWETGDTWTCTPSAQFNTGSDIFDVVASMGGINSYEGSNFWGGEDINCPSNGDQPSASLVFGPTDISAYTGCAVDFYYKVVGYDSGDNLFYSIEYSVDGVNWDLDADNIYDYQFFTGYSNLSTGWTSLALDIPTGKAWVRFTLTALQNGTDYVGFDSVRLSGSPDTGDPVIQITSPTGGEDWEQGSSHDITWSSANFEDNVDIILTDSSDLIIQPSYTTLASNVANSGSWTWNIPADFEARNDYMITVRDNDTGSVSSTSGMFTVSVPPVIVDVVINEILADPDAATGDSNGDGVVDTSQDEFVEFMNMENTAIDISGYQIHDGAALRHTFPAGSIINPGQPIVIFGGGTPQGDFGSAIVQVASEGMLGLNNSGDTVTLIDTAFEVVCTYVYGSDAGDNQSITRNPDLTGDFVKSLSISSFAYTPGKMNTGSSFPAMINGATSTNGMNAGGSNTFHGPGSMCSLEINNIGGNMGDVTVTVMIGNPAPFVTNGVDIWWDILVNTSQTVDLVFHYEEAYLNGQDENLLQIWHYTVGGWVSLGGVVDTAANTVTLLNYNDGFSPFTLAGSSTLPVELSSFTAVCTSENYVQLAWTSQSETDMLGYYVLRSDSDNLTDAINFNELIPAANTSVETQYSYNDIDVDLNATYYYWLQSADLDGGCSLFGPVSVTLGQGGDGGETPEIPEVFGLLPNYPNPFNPSTTIRFNLAEESDVSVRVYNTRGQMVTTLANDKFYGAGLHTITWNAQGAGSGVYFVRLQTGDNAWVQKIVLMK